MNDLLIVETENKGRGVITGSEIPRGKLVTEFTGPRLRSADLSGSYVIDHSFQVGPDAYIGPSGQIDDCINHSCNPNCGLREIDGRFFLYALRKIRAGAELSWDFSTHTNDGFSTTMECRCGSRLCRNQIGDFEDLPEAIQDRYVHLGIVPQFLQARYFEHRTPSTEPMFAPSPALAAA